MNSPSAARLLVMSISAEHRPGSHVLRQGATAIGRAAENDVVLSDPATSQRHLTVNCDGTTCLLTRLPSAGSVYVNGHGVEHAELRDGDQIVIGGTLLHFARPEPADELGTVSQRTVRAAQPLPRLVVECPDTRFELPLRESMITLGRAPGSTIVVPSPLISARHAVMERGADGTYTIRAVAATNPFIVAGESVRLHALRPGDEVRLGTRETGQYVVLTYLAPAAATGALTIAVPDGGSARIGRDPTSTCQLPHPMVSWRHARLYRDPTGAVLLQDLGSRNGTYVNYRPITRSHRLQSGEPVDIGPYAFVFDGATLAPARNASGVGMRIDAYDLVRTANNGRTPLLSHVTLTVRPGEFVSIIGASGAGKTTLMNTLAGIQPPQEGVTLLDGVDIYDNYDLFRGRVGYVPQRDIVHKELTSEQALYYAARLRLPADLHDQEIARRIETVLEAMELRSRQHTVIAKLSGGEQKRLSIAVELLADPQILFLDEPNAALDPDLRGDLLQTLRTLTIRGCTVVVVTHFLEDVEACDRVAVMGRGGMLCFLGSPHDALGFFQVDKLKDVYTRTDTHQKAAQWRQRFEQSAFFVADARGRDQRSARVGSGSTARQEKRAGWSAPNRRQRLSTAAQTWLLMRRYALVLTQDRRRLAILLLQAPLIGLVLALVSKSEVFTSAAGPYDARTVLFFLVIVAIWFGTSNAASEISKEGDIYQRERLTGLGIVPYLLSKVGILAGLCAAQTLVLLLIVAVRTGLPPASAGLFTTPALEIYIGMLLAGLAGVAMGLCISAFAANPDKAIGAVPLVLLPQILLAGVIFAVSGPVLPLANLTISRWAVQAVGTSADLDHLYYSQQRASRSTVTPTGNTPPPQGAGSAQPNFSPSDYDSNPMPSSYAVGEGASVSWADDARGTREPHVLLAWGVVALLFITFVLAAGLRLKLKDPT